jgi:hypothetical protein
VKAAFWTCVVVWAVGTALLAVLEFWGSTACREHGGVPVNDGKDCIKAERVRR